MPLARLYRRAHNAKSPFDRHQAAYFLWEAVLRLLASAAVITFAEHPEHDLVEALRKRAPPNLGDWRAIVRRLVPILADTGDPGFAAVRPLVLDRARDDLPRSAEFDLVLCKSLGIAAAGSRGRVRRELLLIRRKAVPVDDLAVANTLSPLDWALTDTGPADEAEPLLREALAIRQKGLPSGPWGTTSTDACLVGHGPGRTCNADSTTEGRGPTRLWRGLPTSPP